MRWVGPLAIVFIVVGCDGQPTDPCVATESKPVLEILAVHDPATGAAGSALSLSNITLDGIPVDSAVLRTNLLRNVERTSTGIACTLPCSFGNESGTYYFDVRAFGFYPDHAEVVASYSEVPTGCPASHGQPSRVSLVLLCHKMRIPVGTARRAAGEPGDQVAGEPNALRRDRRWIMSFRPRGEIPAGRNPWVPERA